MKEYMTEGVNAYCLLLELAVDQTKLEEIIVLNLDLAKPSEVFFLTMNRMNGTGRGLVIYFKDFSLA